MNKLQSLLSALLLATPMMAHADIKDRLYDFTDAYYRQNGVDPTKIDGRMQPGPVATTTAPNFSYQRNVRALLTIPAYDHSGNLNYFTVLGGLSSNSFLPNAAGNNARALADTYIEYVFPQAGTDPTGLGAFRQSSVLDMRNGYFSKDKLGLWLHVWISYTSKALNTADGKKTLDDIAKKNGRDFDGTPIIAGIGDIDTLFKKGYITKLQRPAADPSRYAICPVVKDPTDGGIAVDQFLAFTIKPDGTPLEPYFVNDFESLRLTGDHSGE